MKDKTEEKIDIPSIIITYLISVVCIIIGVTVSSPMGTSNPVAPITNNYVLIIGAYTVIVALITIGWGLWEWIHSK